jgi:hypothetical protein
LNSLLDPITIGVFWVMEPSFMILAEVSWPELDVVVVVDFEVPALAKYRSSCHPLNIVNLNLDIPRTPAIVKPRRSPNPNNPKIPMTSKF